MKNKPLTSSVFPTEALFPGIHAQRPDIAAADAEAFLAYGHKLDGFDMDNPFFREVLMDAPPEKFINFKVKPRPSMQALLDELPEDWGEQPDCHPRALAIADILEKLYDLPGRGLMAMIMPNRELWIVRL